MAILKTKFSLISCLYVSLTQELLIKAEPIQVFSSIADGWHWHRPEGGVDQLGKGFWLSPVIRLGGAVGGAPERRARDPGQNPGPSEKFLLFS